MVRTRTREKLDQIVDAAHRVFIRDGFRLARVEEIAETAEVAPGTIYRYVEGKEALFELSVREAFGESLPDVDALPYDSEIGPNLIEWIWERLREVSSFERLRAAASRDEPDDARAEFLEVVEEVWDWESRYWPAIELLEKVAREWPELDLLFYRQFRRELLGLAAGWLDRRMERGHLLSYPDPGTAARMIAETITFFAMHRHVRPDSGDLDEEISKESVLTLLRRGFVPPQGSG